MINSTMPFISNRLRDANLDDFFEKVLIEFNNELKLLAENWYQYEEGIDGNLGLNDIFALTERSYIGLFNNAVIRCFNKDSVLQEYSVKEAERKYIRCDYLVKHWNGGKEYNIIFEGKQKPFDGKDYSLKESQNLFKPILKQGRKYYNAEAPYFQGPTFISSLVFDWVRYKKHRDKVSAWGNDDDGVTDFYCFYFTDTSGLMVYGNIEKVQ